MIRAFYEKKIKMKDNSRTPRKLNAFTSTPFNIKGLAVKKQLVEFLLSVYYFDNTGMAEQ